MVPFSRASALLAVVYEKPPRLLRVFAVAIVQIQSLGRRRGLVRSHPCQTEKATRPATRESSRRGGTAFLPGCSAAGSPNSDDHDMYWRPQTQNLFSSPLLFTMVSTAARRFPQRFVRNRRRAALHDISD